MKNNISFLIFVLLVFSGCEKFLEEDPRSILSPNNYFNSEDEIKAGVNGLYSYFYNGAYYQNYGIDRFYMHGADIIEPSRSGTGVLAHCASYQVYDDNEAVELTWKVLYNTIYDANILISSIETKNISEKSNNQYLGEALFLRAFAYYHLTNIYGDVPYYREALELEEIASLGRYSREDIRNDLLDDLKTAQNILPDSYSGNELGRVNKWAATSLMVKIYLIQQNWQEARDKSVEIINNSPHKLLDNYEDVFDRSNEFNAENILQVVFVKDTNPQKKTDHFNPRIKDEPKNSSDKTAFKAALAEQNEAFSGSSLAIPMENFVEEFPDNDLRKPMNIITNYLGYDLKLPYMPKKWNLDMLNSPSGNHGDDYIIFRMADIYLMAAEAENELNGPGDAYQYINKVRERAYEPDQPLSGLSQQEFREAIYDERKWELAGEGHRRMDLIRWGILLDVVRGLTNTTYDVAGTIQEKHVLWPLPGEELEKNPALLESDPTNNGYR